MSGILRSKTNLKSELGLQTLRNLRSNLLEKKQSQSKHKKQAFASLSAPTHITICACVGLENMTVRQRVKNKGAWKHTKSSPLFMFNTRCLARRLLELPEMAERSFLLPSGHTLYCCEDDHAPHHHLQENEHAWHDGVVLCLCGACTPAPKHPSVTTLSLAQLRPTLLFVRKWKRRLLRRLCGPGTDHAKQADRGWDTASKTCADDMTTDVSY